MKLKRSIFLAALGAFLPLSPGLMANDLLTFLRTDYVEANLLNQVKKTQSIDLQKKVWPGSFWPDRAGSVAARYSDNSLGLNLRIFYGDDYNYYRHKKDISKLMSEVNELSDKKINKLSPAEKYDLLVGDHLFSFTRNIWQKIETLDNQWGHLAFWSGNCHGWAPAAISVPTPHYSVSVKNPKGDKKIVFLPDDIKGLVTFLWGNPGLYLPQSFLGSRCNSKNIPYDKKTGQIQPLKSFSRHEDECSDVYAKDFHLLLQHRVLGEKKAVVMDIDDNLKVNNHPLNGVELTYYHPLTKKLIPLTSLATEVLPLAKVGDDPLKKFRHPEAKMIVDVVAKVSFANWRHPRNTPVERSEKNDIVQREWIYQLELDGQFNVVGAQWRGNIGLKTKQDRPRHPDFVWFAHEENLPAEWKYYLTANIPLSAADDRLSDEMTFPSILSAEERSPIFWGNIPGHARFRGSDEAKAFAEKLKRENNGDSLIAEYFEHIVSNGIELDWNDPRPLAKVVYWLLAKSQFPVDQQNSPAAQELYQQLLSKVYATK